MSKTDALSAVADECICHDVSDCGLQLEHGEQWMKGKSASGFGPLGPWMVTCDEIADLQNLGLTLSANGIRYQSGHTSKMIFGVAHIVPYLSRFMRLMPGDVIATGTPAGVGMGMSPPVWLKSDDVVDLAIDRLGQQRQSIRSD